MFSPRDTNELHRAIAELYRAMPGAPMPPKDEEGFYMWGEVDHTDHWAFCEAIIRMMRREAGVAVNQFASERNAV